jgi:hypothetical protein
MAWATVAAQAPLQKLLKPRGWGIVKAAKGAGHLDLLGYEEWRAEPAAAGATAAHGADEPQGPALSLQERLALQPRKGSVTGSAAASQPGAQPGQPQLGSPDHGGVSVSLVSRRTSVPRILTDELLRTETQAKQREGALNQDYHA